VLYRISDPALANPESGHFRGNPAMSGSGHISSQIWKMPVQLQYIQLTRMVQLPATAAIEYVAVCT